MTTVGTSLRDLRIMLGIPFGHPVIPVETALSLALTTAHAAAAGLDLRLARCQGTYITTARSQILNQFLLSDASHLLMVDADMEWTPSDFQRIVVLGTKMPVVGATYVMKDDSGRFIVPGLRKEPNEWGCLPVDGMGLGFTIVQREPLERLAALFPPVQTSVNGALIPPVFRFVEDAALGQRRSEDIVFFDDLRALGYQPYLDPMINLGHCGHKVYRANVAAALGLVPCK